LRAADAGIAPSRDRHRATLPTLTLTAVCSEARFDYVRLIEFDVTSPQAGAQQAAVSSAPDPEVSVNIRNERRPAKRIIDLTATPGSYVTLIRISPLGRVEVLYPTAPVVDRAMIPSSKRVSVQKLTTPSNPLSQGSIFAFVSIVPYVFSKVADDNGWNSLHLANYSAATDGAIAESFGNEIAAPNSRVIMSKATTAPTMIMSHDHSPTSAYSLAKFKDKPCPSMRVPKASADGSISCFAQTISLPGMANPGQGTPMTSK